VAGAGRPSFLLAWLRHQSTFSRQRLSALPAPALLRHSLGCACCTRAQKVQPDLIAPPFSTVFSSFICILVLLLLEVPILLPNLVYFLYGPRPPPKSPMVYQTATSSYKITSMYMARPEVVECLQRRFLCTSHPLYRKPYEYHQNCSICQRPSKDLINLVHKIR
jgi:hypothetical protein